MCASDERLDTMYKRVEIVFKIMVANPKHTYEFDPYQCLAAARLLLVSRKVATCEMGSGQGKSVVLCIVACYFKHYTPDRKVVICTTSDIVKF